jgi:hypothetical protein
MNVFTRCLLAAASACALLSAAACAEALPLNGATIVTGVSTDYACGYAGATPFATQCYTLLNSAKPGGTSGQIEYNNSGAFGGISTTGTGNVVLATSPTVASPTFTGTITGPDSASWGSGGFSIGILSAASLNFGTITLQNNIRGSGQVLGVTTSGVRAPWFQPVSSTVAGLATADQYPADGDLVYVTDATNCASGNALVGSGGYRCLAYYNAGSSGWYALNIGGIPVFGQVMTFNNTITFADGGTWGGSGISDTFSAINFSSVRLQNGIRAGSHGMLTLDNGSGTSNTGYQAGFINLSPNTLSGLTTQDPSPQDGDQAAITDCNANCTTLNGAVTGGGSTHEHVHYDSSSSSWKAG